jgi:hypothetical protein
VADEFYDPIMWAWRKLRGRADAPKYDPLPMLQHVPLDARPGTVDAAGSGEAGPGEAGPTEASRADEPMTEPPREDLRTPAEQRGRRRSDAGDETPSEN